MPIVATVSTNIIIVVIIVVIIIVGSGGGGGRHHSIRHNSLILPHYWRDRVLMLRSHQWKLPFSSILSDTAAAFLPNRPSNE
jgi:hypothetical protein